MKKYLLMALALIVVLNISACGDKKNETSENKNETPVSEVENKGSEPESNVKLEENKIYNTVEDEDGSVTVQEYVYEEDVLSKVNVTIKLEDETKAKEMYESIKNGELKEEYDKKYENVELNGNTISAEMKEDNVEPMKALNQEQMYLILNSSITTYHIDE